MAIIGQHKLDCMREKKEHPKLGGCGKEDGEGGLEELGKQE